MTTSSDISTSHSKEKVSTQGKSTVQKNSHNSLKVKSKRDIALNYVTQTHAQENETHLLFPISMITMLELECCLASSSQVVR